ncbi:MAG: hypothetical protein COA78_02875 [Blastopirellula sp.]|nr:MAG: hypothetical protein COA78_02875 [Blastopirellula sp.]
MNEENPFQSPETSDTSPPDTGTNPLIVPAIILLVLSSIYLILQIFALPGQVIRIMNFDYGAPTILTEVTTSIVALLLMFIAGLITLKGSYDMLYLKNHKSAMSGSVIAMIPFCSPCFLLGIPFGIWAVVLLKKPEVKALFEES